MSSESMHATMTSLAERYPGVEAIQFRTAAGGPLGPNAVEPDVVECVLHDVTGGRLNRPHSDGCTCPDCRPNVNELADVEATAAPIRHFGGKVVHEVGVDLMVPGSARITIPSPYMTLDEHVAAVTSQVVTSEGKNAARIHGDNHGKHQEAGCGANALLVPTLQRLGEDGDYLDDVVDLSAEQLGRMGLGWIRKGDLRSMSMRAHERAVDQGYIEDSSPESRVSTVVSRDGEYEVRDGAHDERLWLINTGNAALAVRHYARNGGYQIFATTPGASALRRIETRASYGLNKDDVAERIGASVLLDTAFGSNARNENLAGFLVHQSVVR